MTTKTKLTLLFVFRYIVVFAFLILARIFIFPMQITLLEKTNPIIKDGLIVGVVAGLSIYTTIRFFEPTFRRAIDFPE